jgi:hypothetical protein
MGGMRLGRFASAGVRQLRWKKKGRSILHFGSPGASKAIVTDRSRRLLQDHRWGRCLQLVDLCRSPESFSFNTLHWATDNLPQQNAREVTHACVERQAEKASLRVQRQPMQVAHGVAEINDRGRPVGHCRFLICSRPNGTPSSVRPSARCGMLSSAASSAQRV